MAETAPEPEIASAGAKDGDDPASPDRIVAEAQRLQKLLEEEKDVTLKRKHREMLEHLCRAYDTDLNEEVLLNSNLLDDFANNYRVTNPGEVPVIFQSLYDKGVQFHVTKDSIKLSGKELNLARAIEMAKFAALDKDMQKHGILVNASERNKVIMREAVRIVNRQLPHGQKLKIKEKEVKGHNYRKVVTMLAGLATNVNLQGLPAPQKKADDDKPPPKDDPEKPEGGPGTDGDDPELKKKAKPDTDGPVADEEAPYRFSEDPEQDKRIRAIMAERVKEAGQEPTEENMKKMWGYYSDDVRGDIIQEASAGESEDETEDMQGSGSGGGRRQKVDDEAAAAEHDDENPEIIRLKDELAAARGELDEAQRDLGEEQAARAREKDTLRRTEDEAARLREQNIRTVATAQHVIDGLVSEIELAENGRGFQADAERGNGTHDPHRDGEFSEAAHGDNGVEVEDRKPGDGVVIDNKTGEIISDTRPERRQARSNRGNDMHA